MKRRADAWDISQIWELSLCIDGTTDRCSNVSRNIRILQLHNMNTLSGTDDYIQKQGNVNLVINSVVF